MGPRYHLSEIEVHQSGEKDVSAALDMFFGYS